MMRTSSRALFFLILLSAPVCLLGQSEEIPLAVETTESRQPKTRLLWEIQAAEDALKAGLSSLAESIYRDLVSQSAESSLEGDVWRLQLASSLLNQQKTEAAAKCLDEIVGQETAEYALRRSLLAYQLEDYFSSQSWLASIGVDDLPPSDHSWFYTLSGLHAERAANLEEAEVAYRKATEVSRSQAHRVRIDTFIQRSRIQLGEVDEALENELREKYESSEGSAIRISYTKEYAVVLDRLGRKEQAQQVLQKELSLIPREQGEVREQILLLIALIVGKDSAVGQGMLKDVLTGQGTEKGMASAFYLLLEAERSADEVANLLSFISSLITEGDAAPHPLQDELLRARARLSLARGNMQAAEEDMIALLQDFPGSRLRDEVLWTRAYIAWSEDPPRYRSAADFLSQLRSESQDSVQKAQLGILVGDCYYLNQEYVKAADFYLGVLEEGDVVVGLGEILFKLVDAEIQAGRLTEAAKHLDTLHFENTAEWIEGRWQAEWNLIHAMREANAAEGALSRLIQLAQDESNQEVPLSLKLRFVWLRAQLSLQFGEVDAALLLCDQLIVQAPEVFLGEPNEGELDSLLSHALFLKGQALLQLGNAESGLEVLRALREKYTESEPAVLSYIEEARYFAGQGRTAEAQSSMLRLADRYPDNLNAPIALYEASLLAEKQSLERNKEEAREILKRLCENYPEAPIFFYATLKQGDILRSLNRFAEAQAVYELLINQFPDHVEGYLPKLYRARCLFARAGATSDSSLYEKSATALEGLYDSPQAPLELRVEAGYMWGLALVKQDREERAREVFWLLITQYSEQERKAQQLASSGRYWLAKSILELGALLEKADSLEEAWRVYQLMIELNLPGQGIVRSKLLP